MNGKQKDLCEFGTSLPSDIVWSYNPFTKSWSRNVTTGDHPPKSYGACAVKHEGRIFLHGQDSWPNNDKLFVYDPKENKWKKEGGGKGRRGEACFVDKATNKLYFFGGYYFAFSNELQIYVNGTWQNQTDERGPTGRNQMAAETVGTTVFVHGGVGRNRKRLDFWRLNLTNLKWEEIFSKEGAAKPQARCRHSLSALSDDMLLLVGGSGGNGRRDVGLSDVWTFEISTNEWKQRDDLPADSLGGEGRGLSGHKAISLSGENGRQSVFITGGDTGASPYQPKDILEYKLVC
jgi:N-acetylneuraminic acid mutarotase